MRVSGDVFDKVSFAIIAQFFLLQPFSSFATIAEFFCYQVSGDVSNEPSLFLCVLSANLFWYNAAKAGVV